MPVPIGSRFTRQGYLIDQVGVVKVTLEGPQGSGKSRLAALFRATARAAGLKVRIVERLK